MKNLIFIILLSLSNILYAQNSSFKAEFINIRFYNDSIQTFDEWTGWHPSEVIAILSENKLTIYSNKHQEYIIVSIKEKTFYEDGNFMRMDAIDIEGQRCTLEFVYWSNGGIYLYIRWKMLNLAYKIRKL